jgi:crotonobetainyl-CoA:carnitine CoA-transferase CaiB-like acyl-CoA transferase
VELARDADIVVESFRPGVMNRLGLGYPTLEKTNPGLIMTSISNFGQTGPYQDYQSSHLIFWSMAGGRYANGEQGKRPLQSGGWLSHYIAGVHGVVGTTAALYQRNETGKGQHVDVSILESTMFMTIYPAEIYSYLGLVHSDIAKVPIGILPCKDGYVGLNVYTMSQWKMLCDFFRVPELLQDPRFQTLKDVKDHMDEVRAIFIPKVMEWEKRELFESGAEWRLPMAYVPTTKEIIDFPQHKERGFFEEVDHPVIGKVTMPGAPFKMEETPWQLKSPAPFLGQHNEEVYCGRLGYTKRDLVRLREQGVI